MKRIVNQLREKQKPAPSAKEVLIISDDQLLSMDIEMSLRMQGFEPRVIPHTSDAPVQLTDPSNYAAVILDIEKPDHTLPPLLDRLTQLGSALIVVSTFGPETVEGLPPRTTWYAKPLSVDDLVVDQPQLNQGDSV